MPAAPSGAKKTASTPTAAASVQPDKAASQPPASGQKPAKADEPVKAATVIQGKPAAVPASSSAGGKRQGKSGIWLLLLLLLVLLLAAAGWWYAQQRFQASERQTAMRLQEAEARAVALEEQIRQLREAQGELQGQLQAQGSALEGRLAESSAQQAQLQARYDEISSAGGDRRITAVGRALEVASQHLALSGDVRAAQQALERAEQQLADDPGARAIGLRRVILQDIERLKSLPRVDLTRSAARLDEVLSRVETLPFLVDPAMPAAEAGAVAEPAADAGADAAAGQQGTAAGAEPPDTAATGAPEGDAAGNVGNTLSSLYQQALSKGSEAADIAWREFTSLVQIRRIDEPDHLVLAPEQKRTVREGLRLQLLNARINLLNRNETLFRQDLASGVETLGRFFDSKQPAVASSIEILTQLQAEPLQVPVPSLDASMEALAAARAESEKGF